MKPLVPQIAVGSLKTHTHTQRENVHMYTSARVMGLFRRVSVREKYANRRSLFITESTVEEMKQLDGRAVANF